MRTRKCFFKSRPLFTTTTLMCTAFVPYLCYGKHNAVDLLELCGGAGRISQVAFSRKLESGGNLDITTGVDLGDPIAQKAILHYLNTCYVMVTVLQPNCRSTGPNSHYNSHLTGLWDLHTHDPYLNKPFCRSLFPKSTSDQKNVLRFF